MSSPPRRGVSAAAGLLAAVAGLTAGAVGLAGGAAGPHASTPKAAELSATARKNVRRLTFAMSPESCAPIAPSSCALDQILAEERFDFIPAVHGLLLTIRWHVVVEEAMPGTVVAVEHVRLAVFFERLFVLVDLIRAGA